MDGSRMFQLRNWHYLRYGHAQCQLGNGHRHGTRKVCLIRLQDNCHLICTTASDPCPRDCNLASMTFYQHLNLFRKPSSSTCCLQAQSRCGMGSPFRYVNFQVQSGLRWKKWHRPPMIPGTVVSDPTVRISRNYMMRCHLRMINFGWSVSGGFWSRFRSSIRRGRRLIFRTTQRITIGCTSFPLIRFFVTYFAFNRPVHGLSSTHPLAGSIGVTAARCTKTSLSAASKSTVPYSRESKLPIKTMRTSRGSGRISYA
jgi:hypothetical protein